MRFFRRISVPVHGLVELTIGLGLIVGSLALDLGPAGMVGAFATGVVLAGIGLGAAESLPLAAHQALDRWLVVVLALGSIGLALAGDPDAGLLLVAVAAGLLALTGVTRWTRPALR